jgi:uncharacterized membrane protein
MLPIGLLMIEHRLIEKTVNDPLHDVMLGPAIYFYSIDKLNVESKRNHNMSR